MADFKYLIVGGGMTADAAVRGIRTADKNGRIGIVSEENHPPYNRPPLSKSLWKGEPLDSIWRRTPEKNLDFMAGRSVVRIEPSLRRVHERGGASHTYEKLLLATGGRPRRLAQDPGGVLYFRTLDDYTALRQLCRDGGSFAVIGSGFIGSEIAAALSMNGQSVTMILPQETIGARVYPPPLGKFLNGYFREKGVTLLTGESVLGVERDGGKYALRTSSGAEIEVDGVVAGLGIEPNTGLAASAGLRVENGISVDEFLRTSDPDVFAAGDVAGFFSPSLSRRVRVEHEDNANMMGETAGKNMAGGSVPYTHMPSFYSDLFDLGYEAVGDLDAELETVSDWKEEFREGVVYYMKEDRVRGVLLWNTWGKLDAARALIAQNAPLARKDLLGLIRS